MSGTPKRIFDTRLRALHRIRAGRMAGERFLWRDAADGIAYRLKPLARSFAAALAIEPQAAEMARESAAAWTQAGFDETETLTAPGRYDLVVSLLSLHGMNDLPGALAQIRARLAEGGFFAAALFGGDTLCELKESLIVGDGAASGGAVLRIAPFADVRDLGRLMIRAGFAHPVADIERTTVHYGRFDTLVHDLRLMGETGGLADRHPLRRETLAAAMAHYRTAHGEPDGKLRATFDIVYLAGNAV
jgi:SAM-dependent methyltransferase